MTSPKKTECKIIFCHIAGMINEGRRSSPASAFLSNIKDRPNLKIIKHATATKIHFDGTKATQVKFDVETMEGIKSLVVTASKEILIAAGALNTPKLLQLSGVGPKDLLRRHGIPVIVNLPVGERLQDHVTVPLFFKYHKSRTVPFSVENFANEVYMYVLHRVGPFASVGAADLVGLINTSNQTATYPDVEVRSRSSSVSGTK